MGVLWFDGEWEDRRTQEHALELRTILLEPIFHEL